MTEEAYGGWHDEAARILEALEDRQETHQNLARLCEAVASMTEAVSALHKRVLDLETRQSPGRYQGTAEWKGTDNLPDGSGTWP